MKNVINQVVYILLLISVVCFISGCSSDDDGAEQNTIKINGTEYPANHTGYIKNQENITLYFGNASYGNATKSVEIELNSSSLTEGSYYYEEKSEAKPDIIYSACYKTDKEKFTNIKNGAVTIIPFDNYYLIQYNLTIDDIKIEGHHTGTLPRINP